MAPNVPEDVAIKAAMKSLRIGAFTAHLTREKPSTIEELYNEFEKYCRSDNDLHRRLEREKLEQAIPRKQQECSKG
jgi:hypothetical protein